jgi:uncharacterized protein (DUF1800 family)
MPAMMERREQQRARAQNGGPVDGRRRPDAPKRTPEQMELARMQRTVIGELSQQRILRAAYSERQLEEVMVDFWMNHFNVFVGKGQVAVYLTEYERDAIRPRVLGKFRDLLGATAQARDALLSRQLAERRGADAPRRRRRPHARRIRRRRPPGATERDPDRPVPRPFPAPDRAIAGRRPGRPAAARAAGLNENYARELMEMHTLGVDGGYTQKTCRKWRRASQGGVANRRLGGTYHIEPRLHDDGEKVVLGARIKAGGGRKDGEQVLELSSPVTRPTARFIATKLARPSRGRRAAAALVRGPPIVSKATDGDIREGGPRQRHLT